MGAVVHGDLSAKVVVTSRFTTIVVLRLLCTTAPSYIRFCFTCAVHHSSTLWRGRTIIQCGDFFKLLSFSLSELQEAIAMVTEVPAPHQMLFHHDQRLWEVVNASYPLSAVNADEEEPIILVNKDESEEESCSNRTLGTSPFAI